MTKQQVWKSETSKIFYGVILYSLCGAIYSLVSVISAARSLGAMFSGESTTTWELYLVGALIIAGYVLFFVGLNNWTKQLSAIEQTHVKKIRIAIILNLCAVLLGFIPVAGSLIAAGLNLAAWIFYLQGYTRLRDSETFPELARKGAGTLRTSTIIGIVSAVIGIIPIIKYVVPVLDLAVMILLILGWNKVKNATF